jgi:hypothetical protein
MTNQHLSCICMGLHTPVFMRVMASHALSCASTYKPPLGTKLGTVHGRLIIKCLGIITVLIE